MSESSASPHRFTRIGLVVVLAVPVVFAIGVIAIIAEWDAGYARLLRKVPPASNKIRQTLVDYPGIQVPPAVSAASAKLSENALVIGVSAGGQDRAYLVSALMPLTQHIINDSLGGRPVTVTYCDRTDHAEVFTDPTSDKPLDVATGGWVGTDWHHGCMLLRVGGTRYRQDTGDAVGDAPAPSIPYPRHEFVRTTWGQWWHLHPDTDVYLGSRSATP